MIVFPPVKINLGLNITAKRPDGFHSLESVFYPVPWTDALEAIITENQDFTFTSSGLPIPGDPAKNLVVKAYKLLAAKFALPGVALHLHKVLPMGAGLGGGSSDGAFALKLLNQVCNLELSPRNLEHLSAELGSDCPFFIACRPTFVSGRGEVLAPYPLDLTGWYIQIIMPAVTIGTAEAYSWITPAPPSTSVRDILQGPPSTWKNNLVNDFEAPVVKRFPVIGALKKELYQNGATYASMSGSGAAVYGLFENEPVQKQVGEYQTWVGRL